MTLIPYQRLDGDTLAALIEAFILREGSDYGEHEVVMERKVEQVLLQIKSGKVVIVFDEETESVNLLTSQDYRALEFKIGETGVGESTDYE